MTPGSWRVEAPEPLRLEPTQVLAMSPAATGLGEIGTVTGDRPPMETVPVPVPLPQPAGRMTSMRAHLRQPLFRTAYALIGSTVLTTGLGMAAAIAAARLYDVEDVGRGQSAINALVILAGLGNLRLMNVLTRFLPRARERSAWLVGRCYLLAAVASCVACAIYLALPIDVLPVGALLPGVPYAGLWFTLAVLAFAIFTLQDAVLTGVRQATWVPLENGIHGIIKLGVVVVFAGTMPSIGIFASWTIPTLLALVPINLLLVRRLLPANAARDVEPEDLSARRLAPFTAAEYGGALCELAVANLVPLVVAARLGLAAAGVFSVAWLIGTTLDHVVIHFGSSLTVEGAADPARLGALTRQLLRRSLTIVAPIAGIVVVGAPLVLRLFGGEYAHRASGLLTLLGLALVPRLVCTVAVVVARVRNQVGAVVGIQALLAAGTLAGSIPLLDRLGIAGPGLAYLISSVVVALLVTPRLVASLREARHLRPDPADLSTPAYGVGAIGAAGPVEPDPYADFWEREPRPTEAPAGRPALTHAASRHHPRPANPGDQHGNEHWSSASGRAPFGPGFSPEVPPDGWEVQVPTGPGDHPGRSDDVPSRSFYVPGTVDRTRPTPTEAPPTRHAHGPGARRSHGGRQVQAGWAAVPLALAGALLALALVQIDRQDTGGALGLVAVLPATWWLGVAALTAGFAWLVVVAPQRHRWLLAHVVLLIVALHATPGLVEAHGRFPTAWTHVGFVDHVVATGSVDPGYDARYNWPGAFSFGGFLVELTGAESARSLVRFAPAMMNLLLLAPLALLVRHISRDNRVRWVGLWLVVITNWVGQDYLAPQPLALLAYLTVVGVLLRWFRRAIPRPASGLDLLGRVRRRYRALVRDDRLNHTVAPSPPAGAGQELGLVVVIALVGAVLAFSHQLTPFMLVLAAGVLVVTGRVDRPLVPAILAVCAVGWVALGTTDFLRSNLETLTGALGDVGGVVQDNRQRVGPGQKRQLVLATRLVLTVGVGGLATWGFWRQWRARRADWALVGLVVAPALLALLNSYGGEVLLRISLFSLPFLAMLGAFALVGEGISRHAARRAGVAVVLVSALLLPLFVTARYGNEAFERIYDDDIAAWDYLVETAPEGATVVVPDFAGPWRYRQLTRFEYRVFADEVGGEPDATALDQLVTSEDGPGYLVLGTGSARYREVAEGYPTGWTDTVTAELVAGGGYEVVFQSGETRILRHLTRPATASSAPPSPGAFGTTSPTAEPGTPATTPIPTTPAAGPSATPTPTATVPATAPAAPGVPEAATSSTLPTGLRP